MAMKRIFKMSVALAVIACGVLYGQRALVSAERPSAVDRSVPHQRSSELSLTMTPAEAMGMKRKMLLAQTTKKDPAADNANTLLDAVTGASGTRTAQAAHNFCNTPDPVFDGVTPFSTIGNSTDGAAHAGCPFDGQTYADNWYFYTATCTGELTASTCSDADYDTDMVVYDGCVGNGDWACPPGDGDVLGCNDDGVGCAGFTSLVTVGVTAGNCYTVRVGGWNSDADQGTGNLTMSCVVVAGCGDGDCPTDVDGDGKTEAFDLAFLLGNWGLIQPDADPAVLCLDADGDGMISAFDLAFLLGNWGQCGPDQKPPLPGEGTPPSIDVPPREERTLLTCVRGPLPEGAAAHLPAYDGDPFFVTIPALEQASVSAEDVRDFVVAPILAAICFTHGVGALSLPPAAGVNMPVADFDGLVQAVAYEYTNNPGILQPRTQHMIDVFLGIEPPDQEIDDALEMGEGMNFAQFVAGIERQEIQYPFQQIIVIEEPPFAVPIEHTMIVASRWDGQSVTTVRGTVIDNFTIENDPPFAAAGAVVASAVQALEAVDGIDGVPVDPLVDGPHLVLLPYGSDGTGATRLRYAYRMILNGVAFGQEGPFLLWLDFDPGVLLKLEPLFADIGARGEVYKRDPGIGTTLSFFQVDAASGGLYTLQLMNVMNRVDYLGDGYDALDVSISDSANGSSSTFANFDQAPINDETEALCDSGTNKDFQQVNFFGTLHRYYRRSLSLGIFTPFPVSPWNPKVQSSSAGCNAWSTMDYGACAGYFDAACPNFVGGVNYMNFAHDNTVVGHELAHNITPRFTNKRPSNWCGVAVCPIPVGWSRFHDLADFWADHFESTNCTAGWVAKNLGGLDASLNCLQHNEGGGLPRLHEVTVPFDPGNPGDHFPEHRSLSTSPYADGQIGAAALWQVRLGMRSKCRPSGLPQFAVRFARALKETGFLVSLPPATDTGIYRLLYDLGLEMVDQWATSGSPTGPPAFRHNGPHTTNKVTAGFARGGVFLIPYQCLDGNVATIDPLFCPTGENGGDAVIDIDDNDTDDDYSIKGVDHREVDFLEIGGPPPTFLVWTGPRYMLDGASGASTLNNPSPCNTSFIVEASTDPNFPPLTPPTIISSLIAVDTDPTTPASPECYGTWTPTSAEWTLLQAGGKLSRIYYRATTVDTGGGNLRISTNPGGTLWVVPPPYAVLTNNGESDY